MGAVAQLGERMTGSHEVRGSIPLSSTNKFNDLEGFCFSVDISMSVFFCPGAS